jgi:protoporphyrinogen/coproporphyrinogen III oxidase
VSPVVVVGAGITGLTAAFTLQRHGADVVLLEADPEPGGKLRTAPFGGVPVDLAADAFLVRNPAAVDLCADLGLADELVHPAVRAARVWSRGALRPIPDNLLGVPLDLDALADSGVVSVEGVHRAARDLADDLPPTPHDDSVGRLARHRLGDEVTDRLVDPFLAGIYATVVDDLSLEAGVPQLAAAAGRGGSLIRACAELRSEAGAASDAPVFAAHPEGMGRIVAALRAELGDAYRPVAATGLVRRGDGWEVATTAGAVDARAVVVTTQPADAAALLGAAAPDAARRLAAIPAAGVVMVGLLVREAAVPCALDASGFVVPRHLGMRLTACSWASSKWAHLARPGRVVLRASLGHIGDPAVLGWSDDRVLARVRAELGHTMGLVEAPLEVRITRWPASFPQYLPGHAGRLELLETALAREAPGVLLAGAAHRGIGIPACVDQGRRAAHRVLAV